MSGWMDTFFLFHSTKFGTNILHANRHKTVQQICEILLLKLLNICFEIIHLDLSLKQQQWNYLSRHCAIPAYILPRLAPSSSWPDGVKGYLNQALVSFVSLGLVFCC